MKFCHNISGIIKKLKCVGKFGCLTYFSCGIHLCNAPCLFLATCTPTLDMKMSKQPIRISKKPDMKEKTVQSLIADKFRRILSHFAPYWLLTLLKEKVGA